MVAAVQSSLRLCARSCSRAPASRRIAAAGLPAAPRRSFTCTRVWRSDNAEQPPADTAAAQASKPAAKVPTVPRNITGRSDAVVLDLRSGMSEEDKQQYIEMLQYADSFGIPPKPTPQKYTGEEFELDHPELDEFDEKIENSEELQAAWDSFDKSFDDLESVVDDLNKIPKVSRNSFWGEEEEDIDLLSEDMDDDDFGEDDIMSLGHGKLEEHREFREYARIAAWQLPLLSKLARPFEPPTFEECLRFRYTTYMGEEHPAQSKVVVEFSPRDIPLTWPQQLKLKKLLGPRYNPWTKIAKMSCEQFDQQAQNKRYLGDLVGKLIAEAKNDKDMFEDMPLDRRHLPRKPKLKFPAQWHITPERQQLLENTWQEAVLLDQTRTEAGSLVDGAQIIETRFKQPELVPAPEFARQSVRRAFPRQRR